MEKGRRETGVSRPREGGRDEFQNCDWDAFHRDGGDGDAGASWYCGAQENKDESPHYLTGCLRKNATADIFLLTDEDGKMWDLRSRAVPLADHVGHSVTVTERIPKTDSKSDDPAPQNHLVVTAVKMARDNCKVE